MLNAKNILILVAGITIGALLIGGVFFMGRKTNSPVGQITVSITPEPTTTPTTSEPTWNENLNKSVIEGSIGFPSEVIPDNMIVCAETLEKTPVLCTSTQISDSKYQYGKGYLLEISPGSYYIYAQIPGQDYKAYYSEFVTCGFLANCPSHNPIPVEVKSGEKVTGINPQDWYNQQSP
jgi:hypothetical protein